MFNKNADPTALKVLPTIYKAVDLKIVKTFGLFVILGVILGTIFAANLKTTGLILFFSVMTMFFASIFLGSKEKINPEKREIVDVLIGIERALLSINQKLSK